MVDAGCATFTTELYNIVGPIEDVTKPSYMDKIDFYLETLYEEDQEFMQLLENKLGLFEITWLQPWYQVSNCLTRRLKNDDKEPFDTNSFTKEEIDHIEKKWKRFRKKYQLPDKPFCLARWRNKDKCRNPYTPVERARRFVMAYLAKGLNRNLHQVYKHFVTHYGYPVKGSYSKYEEKIMELCIYHSPKNAGVILSAVLGREPRGIYKKMKQMDEGKPERKRLKWDIELASKFVNSLIKYSGLSLNELKGKEIDKSVWVQMENDFDQQYVYLRKFWWEKLHVLLYVKKDVKLKKLRKRIFNKLKLLQCSVWGDIRWKTLTKEFPDGFTHPFLYRVARRAFGEEKKYFKVPLYEAVEYALKKIEKGREKRLRNLTLNGDGTLEIIRYHKTEPYNETDLDNI